MIFFILIIQFVLCLQQRCVGYESCNLHATKQHHTLTQLLEGTPFHSKSIWHIFMAGQRIADHFHMLCPKRPPSQEVQNEDKFCHLICLKRNFLSNTDQVHAIVWMVW